MTDRRLLLALGGLSLATLVDYAAKDHVETRRGRFLVSLLCMRAKIAVDDALDGALDRAFGTDDTDDPDDPEGPEPDPADALRLLAFGVTSFVAERLLVAALRRSDLRRPNTVAGAVLAVSRPVNLGVLIAWSTRVGGDR